MDDRSHRAPAHYPVPVPVDFVRGDLTGLTIPAHAEALIAAGPAFLTTAFRAFGALATDNEVVAITAYEGFPGGNSGHKLLLSIAYARPAPELHERLFVKFSRAFAEGYRDRRRFELEAEVKLATLSRLPNFPIKVAKAYFADFEASSGTGLLINEQIDFGQGVVQPLVQKCIDYDIADPIEYYRAAFTTLARMAGAHKRGALSPDAEALFPFDPVAAAANDVSHYDADHIRAQIAKHTDFVARCPQLLPPHTRTPDAVAKFERGLLRFRAHQAEIKTFLHGNPDLIALCHWNAHLDNAWFERDDNGALHCGLLDWGRVRQLNLVYALWGCISAAEITLWDSELDPLLQLFIDEYHGHGGPHLDLAELRLHLDLYIGFIGLVEMMTVPEIVLQKLPQAPRATSIQAAMFRDNELPRVVLHMYVVWLHLWETRDFEGQLDAMLARIAR